MNESKDIHLINGYFHNILSLLKFIEEDNVIKNPETQEMLNLAIKREEEIQHAINNLKSERK